MPQRCCFTFMNSVSLGTKLPRPRSGFFHPPGGSMKVSAEDIPKVPLDNKGILIRIRAEDGTNLGKLWIGQAKVRWARGNVPEKNAKTLSVRSFVDYLNELPSHRSPH